MSPLTPRFTLRPFVAQLLAIAEINRLDRVLSSYRTDSEISTLHNSANEGKSIAVSADLFTVIDACEAWRNLGQYTVAGNAKDEFGDLKFRFDRVI